MQLENKVIVVIGGTTGLGLSAARAFVREGARVVVVGRNSENGARAAEEFGGNGRAVSGDAADPATAPRAIAAALEGFSGFHGLYHVAGGSGRRMGDGPLHEVTDSGIEATLSLNLNSLILSNRAAVRQFLKQESGGSILNMGSVLGNSPSREFFATHVYAAAKSAAEGFTKSCAGYYAQNDIRFNLLAPGLVDTPMAKRAVGDDRIQQFAATKQPLDGGRIGRPEDLDAAAVFFLSDGAKFCTGQTLFVDGGWQVSDGQIPGGGVDSE